MPEASSPPAGGRAAVFLDRDGTLIEDRGHLSKPEQVVFYPSAVPALRRLQERFLLFIVTNQSGVAGGLLRVEDVERVNGFVVEELRRQGVNIAACYYCPHGAADNCPCIKPRPFFLERAAADFGLDLARCASVGDHPHDATLGLNAGGRGVFLLTGHGAKHRHEVPPRALVAAGIEEAANLILDGSH